jgi:hypothetical protein
MGGWGVPKEAPGTPIGSGESQFPIDPKTGAYSSTVTVKVGWEPKEQPGNSGYGPPALLVYNYQCVLRLRHSGGAWVDLDGKATPPAWAQPVGDAATLVWHSFAY